MCRRIVVLLSGPPGAGKTTAALASGLTVYDRDDPEWVSERHFGQALDALKSDPGARAVVIRSAPSSRARARWAARIGATHRFLLLHDRKTLVSRVVRRGRADLGPSLAALDTWFSAFDHDDGCPVFRDWGVVFGSSMGTVSRRFG